MTTRRPARRPAPRPPARQQRPSLVPEHVGEAASLGLVAMAVGGVAIFITGLGMLVSGLTMGSRYAGIEPPPNVDALGQLPALGGIGLIVLGVAIVAAALAVLSDVRNARWFAAGVAALTAILAAAGTILAMTAVPPDRVLAVALAAVAAVFGASTFLILRPAR